MLPVAHPDAVIDRACGAMLGLAIGDALGATVEFMTPREIKVQYGVHDRIRGGGWLRLPAGEVTDDTTMTWALAEAWREAGGVPDAGACARAFDGWMRGKPVDIGNTVRRGILHFRRTGQPWVEPSADAGNGATMRCLPVALGLLGGDPAAAERAALTQARVTHHNPLTDAATVTTVSMLQAALLGAGRERLLELADQLVARHPEFSFRRQRMESPSGYVVDTMIAVFQALAANDSFEPAMIDVVNRGGDADTTGAILGMLMGALCGETGLPQAWRRQLAASARSRCIRLAAEVLECAPLMRKRAVAGV